jgi:PTS system maltose and glucose-specific IIC component
MGEGFKELKFGGAFLYGFTNRLLAPFGLHHVVNAVVRYTAAGGT